MAFSPDGTRLATGGTSCGVRVWDAASGQQVLEFVGVVGEAVAFSPDGTRLATGGYGAGVWDAASGQRLLKLDLGDEVGMFGMVKAVAFSPDGTRLAAGGYGAGVWDAASGQRLLKLASGEPGLVQAIAFSPDGTRLVTGGYNRPTAEGFDQGVRFWDTASGQLLKVSLGDEVGVVEAVAFSPDGTRLVTGGYGAGVWDAASGQRLLELSRRVVAVAFSPDGTRLATGSDRYVWIWPVAGL